jgi:hypothetical protein
MLFWLAITVTVHAQANLRGVIDIHVHVDPDSIPRSIDAIDLAKLAKRYGMRGFVMKNHYESTAALAYIVRKEVPGVEAFGGIDLNRSVGGVNPAAIERMVLMKGGWGKVVWMPTFDNENQVRFSKENWPFVSVSRAGHLLPEVEEVIRLATEHQLTLETGHCSPSDGLLVVHEARRQGVRHVIVTHAMADPVRMTVPEMQEAARAGAYIEFVYGATLPPVSSVPDASRPVAMSAYANAIRAIGPRFCILASDLGQVGNPLPPDGLIMFFEALRKQGIAQADIDLMSKTNPAEALSLPTSADGRVATEAAWQDGKFCRTEKICGKSKKNSGHGPALLWKAQSLLRGVDWPDSN